MKRWIGFVLVAGSFAAMAQDKKGPEPRRTEVVADTITGRAAESLPKIEVSDFVITGSTSLDIPVAEKKSPPDEPSPKSTRSTPGERTRSTPEIQERSRAELGTGPVPFNGKLMFHTGTFLTSDASLWIGSSDQNVRYGVALDYDRSDGFAGNTDYSGGSLNVNGGTLLQSDLSLFNGADLAGSVGIGGTTYGLYGSNRPLLKRTASNVNFSAALTQADEFPLTSGIRFRSYTAEDSAKTEEHAFTFSFRKDVNVAGQTAGLDAEIVFAGISGRTSENLPFLQAGVHSQSYEVGPLIVHGGLVLYTGKGMGGQSFTKLFPELETAIQLNDVHRFIAALEPKVNRQSLEDQMLENPYRNVFSEVRHTIYSNNGRFAFESIWGQTLSSRVSVTVQSINDYPMMVDSAGSGLWENLYLGTVTKTTFRAEMFAKFRSFDYFASSITLNLSRNSTTSEKVPYSPAYELTGEYGWVMAERWNGKVSLVLVGPQNTGYRGGNQLAGFAMLDLAATYSINSWWSAHVSVRNVANQRVERWKGYEEFPFVLRVGASVQW